MTFEHFWLKESKKGMRPALWNEQCARHAWNAALEAAREVAGDDAYRIMDLETEVQT